MKNLLLLFSVLFLLTGCFEPDPDTALKNSYWNLVELEGEESVHYEHQPQIHLIFHINNQSFHGSDGCNRLHGKYSLDGDKLLIKQIVSTRMMCQNGMSQGHLFLQTLTKANRLDIEEDNLILYNADIEIARFEAKDTF